MEAIRVKERPILFSTPMVIAVSDDRKDITRRVKGLEVINTSPDSVDFMGIIHPSYKQKNQPAFRFKPKSDSLASDLIDIQCPFGKEGDILWVRETLYQNGELGLEYVAGRETIDESIIPNDYGPYGGDYSFRAIPNIHMPKWACRLKLKIKSITVERLHDITEEDAIREGILRASCMDQEQSPIWKVVSDDIKYRCASLHSAKLCFEKLWVSINGEKSWSDNPWVWRIEFEKISNGV